MAYDNFENTPFDLNHDGHIDSNEAAYIYDTFYKEHDEGPSDTDIDDGPATGGGWYPSREELRKHKANLEKIEKEVAASRRRRIWITIAVFIAIWLFVGNNILGALIVLGLYILGSLFEFWS